MTSLSALWTGEETVVPAALRGYRSWSVAGSLTGQPCLASTGVSARWGTALDATCLASPVGSGFEPDCPCDLCRNNVHQAPVSDCTCGIYGWYDPTDTRLVPADVFGAIEVTGRVVLGSHGFRAQHAKILALVIEPPSSDMVLARLHRLQSPVSTSELHRIAIWAKQHNIRVFPTRAALLEAFPPEDVTGLIDHDCSRSCAASPRKNDTDLALTPPSPWPTRVLLAVQVAALLVALVLAALSIGHAIHGRRQSLVAVALDSALIGYWTWQLRRTWQQRSNT